MTNITIAIDAYIHTNFGSTFTGISAILSTLPTAAVQIKNDTTTDFIVVGAFTNAYSIPLIYASISDIAIKK
jgi:hypothetical protein